MNAADPGRSRLTRRYIVCSVLAIIMNSASSIFKTPMVAFLLLAAVAVFGVPHGVT